MVCVIVQLLIHLNMTCTRIIIVMSMVLIVLCSGCGHQCVNVPFVVCEIGSEYFTIEGKIAYKSPEENYCVDDSFKYEIGDTIPNIPNPRCDEDY